MKKPHILREGTYSQADVAKLRKDKKIWKECDVYQSQLEELFEILNPACRKDEEKKQKYVQKEMQDAQEKGDWIYFPWSGRLVHTVHKDAYDMLRTNRNKVLITTDEQQKLKNATVGIVGLSVGSHTATSLAYCGIADNLKLAENDIFDVTNLNRVRGRIDQIGEEKIDMTIQQVYEVNPYAQIETFREGLTEKNLNKFIGGGARPAVVFEIIDNFEMKITLRVAARKARVPVVMFSNLGDSILIDVERYDLDDSIPLFNGRAGDTPEDIIKNPDVTEDMKHKYAVDLVGVENVPARAMESVKKIGTELVGRPQLMSTVSISGSLGAYIARKIILGEKLESGRFLVKFDDLLYY